MLKHSLHLAATEAVVEPQCEDQLPNVVGVHSPVLVAVPVEKRGSETALPFVAIPQQSAELLKGSRRRDWSRRTCISRCIARSRPP
jgi:hypothetical protein